jgi:hypothetical protein
MPKGEVLSKVMDKDRNPGPPGWELAVRLKSNLVKTQMSGNCGSEKPWPQKWPARRRRKRIIIGRIFLSSIKTKLMNMQFLLLHRVLWNLYIVHLPTNALFIKLGKFQFT